MFVSRWKLLSLLELFHISVIILEVHCKVVSKGRPVETTCAESPRTHFHISTSLLSEDAAALLVALRIGIVRRMDAVCKLVRQHCHGDLEETWRKQSLAEQDQTPWTSSRAAGPIPEVHCGMSECRTCLWCVTNWRLITLILKSHSELEAYFRAWAETVGFQACFSEYYYYCPAGKVNHDRFIPSRVRQRLTDVWGWLLVPCSTELPLARSLFP